MGANGYNFYFSIPNAGSGDTVVTFPITPSELTIKVGSNNEVVTLIDGGDVNILHDPSLVEVSFEARFPMRKYPYSRDKFDFHWFWAKFKKLKENKESFRFIVARETPHGKRTWDTNLHMVIEEMELKESTDEGDDVLINFSLKQYKEYGVKKYPNSKKKDTTSTSNTARSTKQTQSSSTVVSVYTVKSGDCLYNIAKAAYGNANKWKDIYKDNKAAIEADARKHGKKSSSNGHWIYPGLKLKIKGVKNASKLNVKKLW